MTYLVTDNCIKCKHTDCVTVCPVDCFYEADNFLAIDPDACIDCGVCEAQCPANAIVADHVLLPQERKKWHDVNTQVSAWGINITTQKHALADHAQWDGYANKYEEFGIVPVQQIK